MYRIRITEDDIAKDCDIIWHALRQMKEYAETLDIPLNINIVEDFIADYHTRATETINKLKEEEKLKQEV